MRSIAVALALVASMALGDSYSISEFGIDSKATGLDGTGIEIGQVESNGRSAKAGFDDDEVSASNTIPAEVFFGVGMDGMNGHVQQHSTLIAGVMIGNADHGAKYEGVAPNANLHSAGFDGAFGDDGAALTMNRIAIIEHTTAINVSFGRELTFPLEDIDGRAHLTQFIDWSARRHDVLYVTVWPDNFLPVPFIPSDDYNGITVAASEESDPLFNPGFDKFGAINHSDINQGDAVGDRTSIDILAPGTDISVLGPDDQEFETQGTSVAAPHVTGTVALLQQYVEQQVEVPNPRFNLTRATRHEVMKAVMMNAADKLDGVHGSARTILDRFDNDWTDSAAFTNQTIPLDDELGAGHLNARRAVQQIEPGEYDPGTVPLIGWDYGTVGGSGQINEYVLDQPVEADQYIAITLAWDRVVNHTGGNIYHSGDTFFNYNDTDDILNNLDLYLMEENETNIQNAIWSSKSTEQNLEHIFFKFGENQGGSYKIAVHHNGGLDTSQPYALAWWYGNPTPMQTGDYDGNGSVGPEDYTAWRSSFGSTTDLDADGNGDQVINAADYVIWRDSLGAGSGSGSLTAVPEPSAAILLVFAGVVFGRRRPARERAAQ